MSQSLSDSDKSTSDDLQRRRRRRRRRRRAGRSTESSTDSPKAVSEPFALIGDSSADDPRADSPDSAPDVSDRAAAEYAHSTSAAARHTASVSAPSVDTVVARVAAKMAQRGSESVNEPAADPAVETADEAEIETAVEETVEEHASEPEQATRHVPAAPVEKRSSDQTSAEEASSNARAAKEVVARDVDAPRSAGVGGFQGLGVDPALAAVLEAQGILEPFPVQSLTIPDALAGKNVCGKARTGSGKTLAFGLPLVQRAVKNPNGHPYGLILTPTRELARQVADVIGELAAGKGLVAEAFYGGTSLGKDLKTLRRGVDIVIGTPGRLIDLTERGELHLETVRMVVLDEADRMCDMGFMPQVETLFSHLRDRDQTLLFSATLDGAVDVLVKIYMRDPVFHDVVDDTIDIDSMTHHFLLVERLDRAAVVASIIRGAKRPLVFTRTKRDADRLVDSLKQLGIRAQAIHGDRRQESREKALDDFSRGKLPVLVATDVAARGIHIEGVDIVIHYDPPQDPKAYVHRSGRTARAGETGVVVTLSSIDQRFDLWLLQREIGVKADAKPVSSDDPMLATLATY